MGPPTTFTVLPSTMRTLKLPKGHIVRRRRVPLWRQGGRLLWVKLVNNYNTPGSAFSCERCGLMKAKGRLTREGRQSPWSNRSSGFESSLRTAFQS